MAMQLRQFHFEAQVFHLSAKNGLLALASAASERAAAAIMTISLPIISLTLIANLVLLKCEPVALVPLPMPAPAELLPAC